MDDMIVEPAPGGIDIDPPLPPTGRVKVRSGLGWSLLSRFGNQLMQFGVTVLLARLLEPAAFGTIGMLLVFSGFAQLIADSGLAAALIHRQDLRDSDKSTVFWIQFAGGCVMSLAFLLGSNALARFFHDPALAPLYRAFSVIFALQSLGIVQGTMLRRDGRFRYLAIVTTTGTIVSGVLAVSLALAGFGVWALLWQIVCGTAVSVCLYWSGSRWRPSFTLDAAAARELGGYGIYLLGNSSLNYWLRNGDNLLIGRYLGAAPLGLYSRAYTLMLLPISNISNVFSQVMFPALARLQDDPVAFKSLYLRSVRTIAFAAFPMMVGMWLLSRQFVLILYGAKWSGMIPLLQILSLLGPIQAIVFPVGWIYTSLGRTRDQLLLSIPLIGTFALAMWIGIAYGIYGVTLAYAVWNVCAAIANILLANRILRMKPFEMIAVTARTVLATAVMALVVRATDVLIFASAPLVINAIGNIAVGAVTFFAAAWLIGDETIDICLATVRRFRARRRR